MLTKERKEKQISGFASDFEKSEAGFIVQFQGLDVEQMTQLRSQLRKADSQIRVIRNTLAKRVFGKEKSQNLEDSLKGSNAFVFAFKDAARTAKVLSEFAEDTEFLTLKQGLIGEKVWSGKDIQKLASLPSLDELRAQFLSLLSQPATGLVRVLGEPAGSFARVLNAYVSKNKK